MKRIKLPAGKYFISDPCYVVPDEYWMDVLEESDYFPRSEGGEANFNYKSKNHKVWAGGTAWGDGCYRSNEYREYGVDSGCIGITEWSQELEDLLASKYGRQVTNGSLCRIKEFKNPFTITIDNGRFRFDREIINTK